MIAVSVMPAAAVTWLLGSVLVSLGLALRKEVLPPNLHPIYLYLVMHAVIV